jgi:hypothetical protein
VGQVEQKIGTAEREMIEAVSGVYLHPLKTFLDNDMKSYMVCCVLITLSIIDM